MNLSEEKIKTVGTVLCLAVALWLLVDRLLLGKKPVHLDSAAVNDPEKRTAEPLLFTTYTAESLQKFNGRDGAKILIGIRGKVYDVTKSASFYGPGSSYENFAGRDASRGLAKNSFDPEVLTPVDQPLDTLTDLTESELQSLNDWQAMFDGKYQVVGELVNKS